MILCLLSFFLDRYYFPGNQAKSTLHDCQHRPLRACRPVEDRIRSLPMTDSSGVWAKRICRAVIGKRSKAKSVLGGDFFLFVIFFFLVAQKEKVNSICKRYVYRIPWTFEDAGNRPCILLHRNKKWTAYVTGKFAETIKRCRDSSLQEKNIYFFFSFFISSLLFLIYKR